MCRSMALLINTSKYFFNYRHMANIQTFQNTLIKAGLSKSDILCIAREDPFYDIRNTNKDEVVLDKNISIAHTSCNLEDLTDQYIFNLFRLRHPQLYQLTENDNILIYICGHGADEFFKVCDKYYMFTDDIITSIQHLSNRVNKAVIILDTCQASSLIKANEIPSNVCVITTSNNKEFSYSSLFDASLGVSTVDDFAFSVFSNGLDLESNLKAFFEKISKELISTVSCFGNDEILIKDLLFGSDDSKISKFNIK